MSMNRHDLVHEDVGGWDYYAVDLGDEDCICLSHVFVDRRTGRRIHVEWSPLRYIGAETARRIVALWFPNPPPHGVRLTDEDVARLWLGRTAA